MANASNMQSLSNSDFQHKACPQMLMGRSDITWAYSHMPIHTLKHIYPLKWSFNERD